MSTAAVSAPTAPTGPPVGRTARRRGRGIAALLVGAGLAGAGIAVGELLRTATPAQLADVLPGVMLPLAWLVAATLAVVARPDHPGARLFLGLGVGHLVGAAAAVTLAYRPAGTLQGWPGWLLELVAVGGEAVGFGCLGLFLATFPTGRPATRAERWFARTAFWFVGVVGVGSLLTADPLPRIVDGPAAPLVPPPGLPLARIGVDSGPVVALVVVAGAVLFVLRARRLHGPERRQLSWAVGAAGLLVLMLLSSPALTAISAPVQSIAFVVVVAVVPFVLLAGMVRFRLMDVDLYVARTLSRGLVVVLVLSAYAVLGAWSPRLGGRGSGWAPAVLGVVAALTGWLLISRLETLVDRLLSGGRVRGQALLARLAEVLDVPSRQRQAELTVETIRHGLDVGWVRLDAGDGDTAVTAGAGPDALRPGQIAELELPLLAGDRTVGRLRCGPRHGGWTAGEIGELDLLARHAGLALANAELGARLEGQIVELQASRHRILAADLAARRRLERDLHDGVQQQLVAMIAHLGALDVLARNPGAETARIRTTVATATEQARLCLAGLRELIDGVQPPVLLDRGLVVAVESRAGLLPLPVDVDADDPGRRYPAEVEATAFGICSELLTNVIKHARATRASVTIGADADRLTLRVGDDGVGLEPDPSRLRGVRDRVEALGGALRIERGEGPADRPGTEITACLPIDALAGQPHARPGRPPRQRIGEQPGPQLPEQDAGR